MFIGDITNELNLWYINLPCLNLICWNKTEVESLQANQKKKKNQWSNFSEGAFVLSVPLQCILIWFDYDYVL